MFPLVLTVLNGDSNDSNGVLEFPIQELLESGGTSQVPKFMDCTRTPGEGCLRP